MMFNSAKATVSELSSVSDRSPYPHVYELTQVSGDPKVLIEVTPGHERMAYEAYSKLNALGLMPYRAYLKPGWKRSLQSALALTASAHFLLTLVGGLVTGEWSAVNFLSLIAALAFMVWQVRLTRSPSHRRWRRFLLHVATRVSFKYPCTIVPVEAKKSQE